MKLTCPTCATVYDVPDDAIGLKGRKVRCRACEASWFEPPHDSALAPNEPVTVPGLVPPPEPVAAAVPTVEAVDAPSAPVESAVRPRRHIKGPWLLLALVIVVAALGVVATMLLAGPQQVATRLGLSEQRVPLGIAITREPDWRMIAGGSQLFAVSGRVWNPTSVEQPVPDIRAELKDAQGKTVYAWTITRPVARLAPGGAATFDGAAVDVPPSSSNVSVSFAGSSE